jgi:hypothetical protein
MIFDVCATGLKIERYQILILVYGLKMVVVILLRSLDHEDSNIGQC